MKHTKTVKAVIAMMLTLAIALSGATFESMTANAQIIGYTKDRTGMEDANDMNGTTITMKVGDSKKVDMQEAYGSNNKKMDVTDNYNWTSSDESVVSLEKTFTKSVAGYDKLTYVTITAQKAGTAVITATGCVTGKTAASFTVTVKQAETTAKQQKCKHSWKTTKKATCMRTGVKTCKKCKLQKTIAKKAHNFATKPEAQYEYTYDIIFWCQACVCEDKATREYHNTNSGSFECEHWCDTPFTTETYGSVEAAKQALFAHQAKEHPEYRSLLNQYLFQEVPVEKTTTYKAVTRCTICKMTPEELEKYE